MSLERRAQVLEAVVTTPLGVRDVVKILKWKTSGVISLLKKMSEERLIELQKVMSSKRGRPEKRILCTSLGIEFLEVYRKLKMKPLRAREEDLEHAVKDALYTNRLVANGHSAFKIFMELNTIARNIKVSSEASKTI